MSSGWDGTPFPCSRAKQSRPPCCACCISGARANTRRTPSSSRPARSSPMQKIRCWARRSWTCCGRSWTASLRFTAPISRRCAMPGRWTMTTRWSMPCASCGRSRRSCTNSRRAITTSAWTRHRIPRASSMRSSRCWPVQAAICFSSATRIRASMASAPPARICCCTLRRTTPAQRSCSSSRTIAPRPRSSRRPTALSARMSPAATSTCSPSVPAARPSARSR